MTLANILPLLTFLAEGEGQLIAIIAAVFVLILVFLVVIMAQRYKRCPSNKILVVFGKGVGGAAKTIHGGAAFILPLFQDFSYLSLDPMPIDIDLRGALTKKNIRVNVPCSFTVAIGIRPELMQAAAERLLGLDDRQIQNQAMEIIVGQLRLVVATLSIEEINQDREKFLTLVHENVGVELHKIGLEVINVNIRDITDDSGYIDAIGKRAAAEAINAAKIEVAQEEKKGATGEARENQERIVAVAAQQAIANEGKKTADRNQRIAMAKLEAESVGAEAQATREQEVKVASERAQAEAGKKDADRIRRIKMAEFEAQAIEGENASKARVAQQNAMLAEAEAEGKRRSEVAQADAQRVIFEKQRALESAKLEKEIVVHEEIAKRQIEIQAAAVAERTRLEAQGQADATLAKYNAEAEGIRRVLEAKAAGYRQLIEACAQRPDIAPTLLMIEKLPEIISQQVKAIQNLKIDKVTVWDSGNNGSSNGKGGTAGFLSSLIGSLPQVHELAEQAGIKLPGYLGSMDKGGDAARVESPAVPPKKG